MRYRLLLATLGIFFSSTTPVFSEPTVGLFTELSGSFAASGVECRRGYEVAIEEAKKSGSEINFYFGDTRGEARVAVSEMQRLIETRNVSAIVVNRSQVGMALAAMAERSDIPLIGVVGHSDFISRYSTTFRSWPDARLEGQALARVVWNSGHKVISIATLEDEYLVSLSENFESAFKAMGGEISESITVLPSDADYRTTALRLVRSSPDALFINLGIPQLGPMYRTLGQLYNKLPTFSNYWLQSKEVLEDAGAPAQGAVWVEASLDIPNLQKLVELYSEKSGNLMMTYTCYVAARLAIEAAGADSQETIKNLNGMTEVNTPDGTIKIENREIQFELVPKRVGKL